MHVHGAGAEEELLADVPVGEAGRDKPKDFLFPWRQPGVVSRSRCSAAEPAGDVFAEELSSRAADVANGRAPSVRAVW